MKKCLLLTAALSMAASTAFAGVVSYVSPKHVFSTDDVMCNANVFGSACLSSDLMLNEKDGQYYYGIDSAYGYQVQDFTEPVLLPMDGIYDNGMISNIADETTGAHIGVHTINQITGRWMAGALKGEWAAGLGGLSVKAASEHYLVMDHVLNAEWMPPLVEVHFDALTGEALNIGDFATRMKDDGKVLFFWGNMNKEPTPLRLYVPMPLPETWKQAGANYTVTSAKLVVKHRITTSPNDQIRPEDFENENATGILPQYTVGNTQYDDAGNVILAEDGKPLQEWYSAVDAYEGDGDFIPAGTLLRSLTPVKYDITGDGIADYVDYKTNAWYTSLDRDPFGGPNPRYRLKSSKYGQDNPGVELPQYPAGQITTTTIDLLTIKDDAGNPILAESANWFDYLDINPEKLDYTDDNFTADGCPLTPDFDLMIYVKGEYSGTEVFDAQLMVEYEDPNAVEEPPAPSVDIAVANVTVPRISTGETGNILVSVINELTGEASGILTVEVVDNSGAHLETLTAPFTTDETGTEIAIPWTAPTEKTVVTATAVAEVPGDIDTTDNTNSGTTLIR